MSETTRKGADRLPVVFIHGIRVSGSMWKPVADLVGKHRPVLRPDMPGHGSRRGETFTAEGAVEAVVAAIDEVGGRAVVAGMSLGGFVGMITSGHRPEKVAALVAVGCTARLSGVFAAGYRVMAGTMARNPARGDRLSARGFARSLPPQEARAFVEGGVDCSVMPQVAAQFARVDPVRDLGRYPGPVWLVNGSSDPFRRNEADYLGACHNGRLVIIPGRGHISCMAETRFLATLVEDACTIAEASLTG